tara:strand:+ start:2290 stop:2526 length:237 start_codon:yes stop_codon:yes gene_type:complete
MEAKDMNPTTKAWSMDTTVFLEENDYDLWNDLPAMHPLGTVKTVNGGEDRSATTWFTVRYEVGGTTFVFAWAAHHSFE